MLARMSLLFAGLALVACQGRGAAPLTRLQPYAGEWRCPMDHLTAGDASARHVVQDVTIALEPDGARYAVRFAPDREQPSPDAVTSVAYWSYDGMGKRFTSEAHVGEGEAAAEERYSSPGPDAGKLVWTGELRSAISAPIRMTFARAATGLEILVEAYADDAWKPLSMASCTRVEAPRPAHFVATATPQLPAAAGPPQRSSADAERAQRALALHGAPRSPFVDDASDRFAYKAVQASAPERRAANAAADQAQAAIDQAVELSSTGKIEKLEAVRRIQQAYGDRDRALDRIFGEDRASVLRDIHVVDGVEVSEDGDPE